MGDQQALEQTAAPRYSMLVCGGKLERTCKLPHINTLIRLRLGFKALPPPPVLQMVTTFLSAWQMRWPTFYWRALAHLPAPQSTSAHVDPGFSLFSSFSLFFPL